MIILVESKSTQVGYNTTPSSEADAILSGLNNVEANKTQVAKNIMNIICKIPGVMRGSYKVDSILSFSDSFVGLIQIKKTSPEFHKPEKWTTFKQAKKRNPPKEMIKIVKDISQATKGKIKISNYWLDHLVSNKDRSNPDAYSSEIWKFEILIV
jgi:hypothetical protein